MYDIIIIGAGPAGLSAGIYGGMANKKILILEKNYCGGQVASISQIKNYPGFETIDGFSLSQKMKQQAISLGVKIVSEEVKEVNLVNDIKIVKTYTNTFNSKAVIIASGAYAKQLDVDNEKYYLGRGVSYCATCDGNFFKDKVVAVVGGGNTSLDDCIYLSNIVKKIYLIHRRDVFTGSQNTLNVIKNMSSDKDNKIEILTNCIVTKLSGNEKLEQIEILNKITNKKREINLDGLFVAIGRKPDTEIFSKQIELTEKGFIKTNSQMQTNIKNVYAVGDVRDTNLRQIVTACADGAIAVTNFISSEN